MFLEIFSLESQWKKFIEKYEKANTNRTKDSGKGTSTLITDENIWPFIISAFYSYFKAPLLVVTSTLESATELEQEINCIIPGVRVLRFPSIGNSIFYKNKVTPSGNIIERLRVIKNLIDNKGASKFLIIATSNSLLNMMPSLKVNEVKRNISKISGGMEYGRDRLIKELSLSGYERVDKVYDRGEYSVRGEVVDIFDVTCKHPVRVDFIGDEVEKVFFYDTMNQKPVKHLKSKSIFPNINPWKIEKNVSGGPAGGTVTLIDLLKKEIGDFSVIFCDPEEIYLKIRSDIDILKRIFRKDKDILVNNGKVLEEFYLAGEDFLELNDYFRKLNLVSNRERNLHRDKFSLGKVERQKKSCGSSREFIRNVKKDLRSTGKILISINAKERIKKIEELFLNNSISYSHLKYKKDFRYDLLEPGVVNIFGKRLYRGFRSRKISLYGELDIYEQMKQIPGRGVLTGKRPVYFSPGEYVVHKAHGIGRYVDIVSKQVGGFKREYFLIEYAGNDKLYIPTWQADRVNRYIGSKNPTVTSITSRQWDGIKKRVRRSVRKLALDITALYAKRNSASGYAFPEDSPWQRQIEDSFPFRETPDQIKAINHVKDAMKKQKPMDILVIGDVGFGKTEVAIRAAFKAIESGKQVLLLVPTTILADQHYYNFSKRYKNYPVILEVMSRFKTGKEQKEVIKGFREGKVDMVIGTHRILQEDLKPKDLGLIIIDEEQRFGVNSKEKIKLLKTDVDVLTLSATPIPRTLYMSLSGIRNMVLIETHPEGRSPVKTFVGETNYGVIKTALERELARAGQAYYVYNRISGIDNKKAQLQQILPHAKIALTHGQMEGSKIEKVMREFIDKKYDILLTTSIIESGMDIENVNTLMVENSHLFGLSQLYQLRGRVGRSSEIAYAYFFYPGRKSMNFKAFQRLKTLSEYTDLGSGYNIAMRDLEIRGAGEILGPRQHGHINSVGFDMYCQIIKEEIGKLKGMKIEEDIDVQIELPASAYIPKSYIGNESDRINIYKILGNAKSLDEIDKIKKEIVLKYGNIPAVIKNLINISKIKYLMKKSGIEKIAYLKSRGIYLKKVNMSLKKAGEMTGENSNLLYEPALKTVTIKNVDKNINLDLVLNNLNGIIKFM
ncbi:MAG: transcription-repair coupling factor [Actinomycetota bacterium]|nr:transcription-repair coupling factor [Actinomycetota bacterium]